jgi:DNA-binding NarL/FixJ family response regulator
LNKSPQNGVSSSQSLPDSDTFWLEVKAKMESLHLVVADDHDIVRRGLRDLLEQQVGWKVVAEATNGKEAVEKVLKTQPDVAVLDIQMPVVNGLEAAKQIVMSGSKTRILILTIHESDTLIREMLDAGVRGYVLKSDAARDLVSAVEALRRNRTFFSPQIQEMVLDGYLKRMKKSADMEASASRLTPRQREVLKLLAEGKTSSEAAAALGMSNKTAETHRAALMTRLNCHSISDLVRYAVRNKIIEV